MIEQKMNYLTDEELEKLIEDVEMQDMLKCPSNLRREILEKTQVPLRKKKLQFYAYSFKVCAATAAAIVLLFTIPAEPQMPVAEAQSSFTEELSRHTNMVCESLNKFSDMLISVDRQEE